MNAHPKHATNYRRKSRNGKQQKKMMGIFGIAFVNYLPKLINNHGEYETPE
jgi:hypothetical protein